MKNSFAVVFRYIPTFNDGNRKQFKNIFHVCPKWKTHHPLYKRARSSCCLKSAVNSYPCAQGLVGVQEYKPSVSLPEVLWCFHLCSFSNAIYTPRNKYFPHGFGIHMGSRQPFDPSRGKESASNAEDLGSIPGLGRCPEERNGYPLQYSCLGNTMDGWVWWATVCGLTKSWTQLSN